MQEAANFIGELGGDTWTTQAIAVVVAGVGASLAAGLTAWVAIRQGHKTRKQEREIKSREHWWSRFKDVCDDLTSKNAQQRDIALVLMEKLSESEWAEKNDKLMIVSVLAELRRSTSGQGLSK